MAEELFRTAGKRDTKPEERRMARKLQDQTLTIAAPRGISTGELDEPIGVNRIRSRLTTTSPASWGVDTFCAQCREAQQLGSSSAR
jgi:hypothetical protein